MKRVLVTGSNGFVGSYVVQQLLNAGYKVFATSQTSDLLPFKEHAHYQFIKMDFTDGFDVYDAFEIAKPDVVVHAGAMSKPDDCEQNQSQAYNVNVGGTLNLLLNAVDYKSHFIYFSTDFIFNGEAGMHQEEAAPQPLNYYGRTKAEAEDAVKEYEFDWTIVRTVFVYGKPLAGRDCFVTMIAKKLLANQPFKVVNDQYRTATYAPDLAKGIALIIQKNATGIFNICGKDMLTPYEMAVETARHLNITTHWLTPVTCNDFKEIAKRPLKSGLDISKAKKILGYDPVSFEEGLSLTLR